MTCSILHFVLIFIAISLSAQRSNASGSCKCESNGGFGLLFEEARYGVPFKCNVVNRCEHGCECDDSFSCTTGEVNCYTFGDGFVCEAKCTSDGEVDCVEKAGGNGDPHFTGFDGSKFDFHGVNGHNYVLFGSEQGDMLVGIVRSSRAASQGITHTFFDQFGLQIVDSSDNVHVSLVRHNANQWKVKVELNGREVFKRVSLKSSTIDIDASHKLITVSTAKNTFKIRGVFPRRTYRRHLDFEVSLRKTPTPSENYLGIIGMTLNRKLRKDSHPEFSTIREKKDLELAMRKTFGVQSLFPPHERGAVLSSKTSRTLIRAQSYAEDTLPFTASVRSM